MYYVYHGYRDPDNFGQDGPTHHLDEIEGIQEVMRLHAAHLECITDECKDVVFRVIKGEEKRIVESKAVVEYRLI